MKNYNIALRPIHYACVSGGKDSLYMFRLLCDNQDKYPLDMVVHYDLEIDYPFVKNVVDYIEKCCKALGIKFVRVKPEQSYWDLLSTYGVAKRQYRWCNSLYKMSCVKQIEKWIKEQNCRPVAYIGLCADEQNRFKYTVGNIVDGQDVVYPLAEEGVLESDILEWAKDVDIFDSWYSYFNRQGCMYCPNATYRELAYMYICYNYQFEWFMTQCINDEERTKSGVFQSNPKYNSKYVYTRVREHYVPIMWEEMKEKKHPITESKELVYHGKLAYIKNRKE